MDIRFVPSEPPSTQEREYPQRFIQLFLQSGHYGSQGYSTGGLIPDVDPTSLNPHQRLIQANSCGLIFIIVDELSRTQ